MHSTDWIRCEKESIGHFPYKFKMTLLLGMLMKALHNGRMNEDIAVDSE